MNEQPRQPEALPPAETPPTTGPEQHETDATGRPRIYVASLSDYNNGLLHGEWIDAGSDPEALQQQIDDMLKRSPTSQRYGDTAEEWAIHDYDGFEALRIGEHETLSTIAVLAGGIRKHGPAFAAWVDHTGERGPEAATQYEEAFLGHWPSVDHYAASFLDDLGAAEIIDQAPSWLQAYLKLDTTAFAHALQLGGDIIMTDNPDGGVWVFKGW